MISGVAAVLTPYLVGLIKEKIIASANARLGAAADTVAVEMANAVGSVVQQSIDTGVEKLKARLPDTVAKLAPSDETLRGLILKAQSKLAATTTAVPVVPVAANQ
ncbi:hypothetical protein RADP37_05288 [Roseomonas mucosa]|uniref:Uncharacterized protein n=1 Tax=Roseomonas mucosa TaxID=207340 RepID=A0A4Y1MUT6_9PROT|nr:hypothetical protein [Roseomonas mucosa]AWV21701.1 hypothetical protein RADP37_05288 [Roseomonas mucosa]MDT8355263.1 hypothetical protein [Roseomonas mucosa]